MIHDQIYKLLNSLNIGLIFKISFKPVYKQFKDLGVIYL